MFFFVFIIPSCSTFGASSPRNRCVHCPPTELPLCCKVKLTLRATLLKTPHAFVIAACFPYRKLGKAIRRAKLLFGLSSHRVPSHPVPSHSTLSYPTQSTTLHTTPTPPRRVTSPCRMSMCQHNPGGDTTAFETNLHPFARVRSHG